MMNHEMKKKKSMEKNDANPLHEIFDQKHQI